MQLDFGIDNTNEFVYYWNNRLEIGQIDNVKLPILLNPDDQQSSFCIKVTAIDVLDQNDANMDDNSLCASLSNKFYIIKLFNSGDYLNLWINIPSDGQLSYKIVNVLGQTVLSTDEIDTNGGMNKYKFPILNLNSGIYMLQINYNGNILTRMFDLIGH